MSKTIGRINREGTVNFGDASLAVWEEGLNSQRNHAQRDAWERVFKRQVFARIVQTLNRLGWICAIPQDYIKTYSLSFARDRRECSKGALKGWLEISGRTITFETWQGVNTPTRPDHGGRYESNKEACMPYVLRLEMERTRRRIRDYLLNVFTGYAFDEQKRSIYLKPMEFTALERIQRSYAESHHFKGDMAAYLKSNGHDSLPSYNCTSLDGKRIEHGSRVWFIGYDCRIGEGIAYYNINNMWWIATGLYGLCNVSTHEIYAQRPPNPRVKRNACQRRKRLEGLLSAATKAMQFERAAQLRDILFPKGAELFAVFHEEHGCYHRTGFCDYTKDLSQAGKFTAEEVKGWDHAPNRIVPLRQSEAVA